MKKYKLNIGSSSLSDGLIEAKNVKEAVEIAKQIAVNKGYKRGVGVWVQNIKNINDYGQGTI